MLAVRLGPRIASMNGVLEGCMNDPEGIVLPTPASEGLVVSFESQAQNWEMHSWRNARLLQGQCRAIEVKNA